MPFASRLVLHVPVSDETLLHDFVEQCLKDRVSLVAVFGPGCRRIEDVIDEIVVGDGSDEDRYLTTSSHEGDTLEDVLSFAESWESGREDAVEEVRL